MDLSYYTLAYCKQHIMIVYQFYNCCMIFFGNIIKLLNFTNFLLVFIRPVIYRLFHATLSSQIQLILMLAAGILIIRYLVLSFIHRPFSEIQNSPQTKYFSFFGCILLNRIYWPFFFLCKVGDTFNSYYRIIR